MQRRERRTVRALLLSERSALARYRIPVQRATHAVIAAQATGRDPIAQVRQQVPALRGELKEEISRSHQAARSAGRLRLEEEAQRSLHSAPGTLVADDAFAEILASSLTAAWGQTGLQLLSGNEITVTASQIAELAELVDAKMRRAAATEVARTFNDEREALFEVALGLATPGGTDRDRPRPEPGAFKIWCAVLDGKTCSRCFAVDGEVVELHRTFSADLPMHPHCRCVSEALVVAKPERLEDIAIDYDLFKQELRDVIREDRAVSQRHAQSFAAESLGAKRSPLALTKRFHNEPYTK